MLAAERQQGVDRSWRDFASSSTGVIRATGRPCRVTVIVSPASTSAMMRARWVLSSYAPTVFTRTILVLTGLIVERIGKHVSRNERLASAVPDGATLRTSMEAALN